MTIIRYLCCKTEIEGMRTRFSRFDCQLWLFTPLTFGFRLFHLVLGWITGSLYHMILPILSRGNCLTLWFAWWLLSYHHMESRAWLIEFGCSWRRDTYVGLRGDTWLSLHVYVIDWFVFDPSIFMSCSAPLPSLSLHGFWLIMFSIGITRKMR